MFSLTSSHRYFMFTKPTDMRKSFDGLCGIVSEKLNRHATNGDVFVFFNKRRDRLKLLHWETGGFVLYYKRLEKGVFLLPESNGENLPLAWSQLVMIIEGFQLKNMERSPRYTPQNIVKKVS